VIGALVAVAAFLIGVASSHQGSPLPTGTSPAVAAPTRLVNGIPLGWPRTREGAVGAAVDAASQAQDLILYPDRQAPALAPGYHVDESGLLSQLGYQAGSRLLVTDAPVLWRIVDWTPDRAVVDVWGVNVVAMDPPGKVPTLAAAWGIQRQALTWQGGDWKLQKATLLSDAPVPSVLNQTFPTAAGQAMNALDGFQPFVSTAP
jgi:hypothetical protein